MPRTGTILLVDDEEGIRAALQRLLLAAGHLVVVARHGAEALEMARVHRGSLDLVLSDVVMPEMNGAELADALAAEYPGLAVILMSGYAPAGLTEVVRKGHNVPLCTSRSAWASSSRS
jgi:two-component system, cell cycle sensor histidine kinase and response regulator CckA